MARWVVTRHTGLNLKCKLVKGQEELGLGTGYQRLLYRDTEGRHIVGKQNVYSFMIPCTKYDKDQHVLGHEVGRLVEALRYKPEGRGFDSRGGH